MLKNLLWDIVFLQYNYTYACANCREINFSCGNSICHSKYIDEKFDVILIFDDNENIQLGLLYNYAKTILEYSSSVRTLYIIKNEKKTLTSQDSKYTTKNICILNKNSLTITDIPIHMLIHRIEDLSEYFVIIDDWKSKQYCIELYDFFTSNGIALLHQTDDGEARNIQEMKSYFVKKGVPFPENIHPRPGPYGLTKEICKGCFEFFSDYFMTGGNSNFDYKWAQQLWLYSMQHGILYNNSKEIRHA